MQIRLTIQGRNITKSYNVSFVPGLGDHINFDFDGLVGYVDSVTWLHLNEVKVTIK